MAGRGCWRVRQGRPRCLQLQPPGMCPWAKRCGQSGNEPDLCPNAMEKTQCHEVCKDGRPLACHCPQEERGSSAPCRLGTHCRIHAVPGGFSSRHLNNSALVRWVLISAAGPSGRKYQMLQEIILRVTQRCWLQRPRLPLLLLIALFCLFAQAQRLREAVLLGMDRGPWHEPLHQT